jgi:carbon storage regulator
LRGKHLGDLPNAGLRPGALLGEACAMLVLSRKKNESIIIDQEIRITVVEIRGDKVRLGIEAPKEVPVHRSEIHAAIQSERAAAEDAARASASPAEAAKPDLT